MITIDNYFGIIKDKDIRRNDLPPVLRKGWDLVNQVTKRGESIESYWKNKIAKETIDLYFDNLAEFIEDEPQLFNATPKSSKTTIIKVPEISVSFDRKNTTDFPDKITGSDSAAKLIRSLFNKGEIELHEVMFVVYLNRANQPIGYYKHSIGGISGTVVDIRIILGAALKSLSSALILSHNHPSGNTQESQADKQLTKQLVDAAKLFNISILDHVILTKDSHSSFADQGLMGVNSKYPIKLSSPLITNEKKKDLELLELEGQALELELELLDF